MAVVAKWLTHLTVTQALVGSIPICRPILKINAKVGETMALHHLRGPQILKAKLNEGLVVVEYFGDFCTSCKVVEKSLLTLSEKYPKIRFYKISAVSDLKFAQDQEVSSLPTIHFFKDGKKLISYTGFRPLQHLEQALAILKAA
jgi:thioredoxin 1